MNANVSYSEEDFAHTYPVDVTDLPEASCKILEQEQLISIKNEKS
jgi:hypothetical protein